MFFRRSTHPSESDLSAYVDGELDMAQARRLTAHLNGCGECRTAIEGLRNMKALMADLPREPLSRSFTLSAAQAGVQATQPLPARPNVLRFAPALSLAVLAVLLVVDIATPGRSSQSTSSAGHNGLVAKSAAESAGSAADKAQGAPSLQVPRAAPNSDAGGPGSAAPSTGAAVIPPTAAPPLGNQAAPSAPSTQAQAGAAASPPQVLSQPAAPSPGGATAPPPALAPPAVIQPFAATAAAGGAAGAGAAATPQAAADAPSSGFNPLTPVAPQAGALNPVAPVPSPAQETSITVATKTSSGVKLLRVFEILAAATFIVSCLIVIWPRLRKER